LKILNPWHIAFLSWLNFTESQKIRSLFYSSGLILLILHNFLEYQILTLDSPLFFAINREKTSPVAETGCTGVTALLSQTSPCPSHIVHLPEMS